MVRYTDVKSKADAKFTPKSMNIHRVVIKIGTSILAQGRDAGEASVLESLVGEICDFQSRKWEMILVTSGAIGMGVRELGWARRPQDIPRKQAAAAVGQVGLMGTYQKLFGARGATVAQVLLSRGDFEDRRRYLNARNTLQTLIGLGVVPIINENDTVAVDEIRFGDNDRLSAMVAAKMSAGTLVILSDVDGLYRSSARRESDLVGMVPEITEEVERLAWKSRSDGPGTGGMASKIDAAKIASHSGVVTVVANGFRPGVLGEILAGKPAGTKFLAAGKLSAREKWLLFGAVPKGDLVVDSGAEAALRERRKSLLAIGVTAVRGAFRKGDVVRIRGVSGREIARGTVNFSSEDTGRIRGLKSSEVRSALGSGTASGEVVHRDSLALLP